MKNYHFDGAFELESGHQLEEIRITYHTFGELNAEKSNVIWVCHALTANSDVSEWWSGLFGSNRLLDPEKYFIVCANVLGSCYGSTGPASPLKNKRPMLDSFPDLTIRDLVKAHRLLAAHLEISSIEVLIGASVGGQQALEWAVEEPARVKTLIVLASNAVHSAYGRAFNESQRLAIEADQTYGLGLQGGRNGLIAARSIAMLSYRSYDGYALSQREDSDEIPKEFKAASYQRYQGVKLANRFNAYSYYLLTKTMDSHDLGRKRNGIVNALKSISAKTLVVGISSDVLFPTEEQRFLAEYIPHAQYQEIHSSFGHDGFLIEVKALNRMLSDFLDKPHRTSKPLVETAFKQKIVINNN